MRDSLSPGRSALRRGPQAELLETGAQLFEAATHARREDPEVGAPDGQHAAVEVLALPLERGREPVEDVRVGIVELVQPHEVDRETGVHVEGATARRVDETDLAL